MSIRTKIWINMTVFALLAIALAAQDLRVTHPDLFGL